MVIYTIKISKMLYSEGTIQYIKLLSEKYYNSTFMSPYNKDKTQSMEHAAGKVETF